MGFPEAPKLPEAAKSAEISQAQQTKSLFSEEGIELLHKLNKQGKLEQKSEKGIFSEKLGPIESMHLPKDWTEKPQKHSIGGVGAKSMREFNPPDEHSQARLGIYYRGLPIPDDAGSAFKAALHEKAPHNLMPSEIASLKPVLEELADPKLVTLRLAKTEILNGKPVLHVQGTWNSSQKDIDEYLFPCNDACTIIKEAFYEAPKSEYPKYSKAATESLKSIILK